MIHMYHFKCLPRKNYLLQPYGSTKMINPTAVNVCVKVNCSSQINAI